MNFAQIATSYIAANILLTMALLLLASATLFLQITKKPLTHRIELKSHYFCLSLLFLLFAIHPYLPKKELFPPIARVWSATSGKTFAREYQSGGFIGIPTRSIKLQSASNSFVGLALLIGFLGLFRLLLDIFSLYQIKKQACLIRKIHSVRIYIREGAQVPFSYWFPGQRNIVLPETLIGKSGYQIAVLHELQHHRQLDTYWVYLFSALRIIFILNPAIHIWNRWISELQEFACDEALVRRVSPQAYARCLLEVAQTAVKQDRYPVCATGLSFLVDRNTIKRRIHKMLNTKHKQGWKLALPIGAAIIAILSATAYASQGFVQDRRITMAQAEEMAKSAQSAEFPVVVNEKVLKWLNYYLGTPEGREKVQAALARMESFRTIIAPKFAQYHVPEELLAVPLIESGDRNLEAKHNPVGAAGLWQFISSTARNFGLRVDSSVDERLNIELETDAAMRLLLVNKLRFNDWALSLLSYNSGETYVQNAINRKNTRDPWELIASDFGSEENTEYLPKIMAGILLLKNPQ